MNKKEVTMVVRTPPLIVMGILICIGILICAVPISATVFFYCHERNNPLTAIFFVLSMIGLTAIFVDVMIFSRVIKNKK